MYRDCEALRTFLKPRTGQFSFDISSCLCCTNSRFAIADQHRQPAHSACYQLPDCSPTSEQAALPICSLLRPCWILLGPVTNANRIALLRYRRCLLTVRTATHYSSCECLARSLQFDGQSGRANARWEQKREQSSLLNPSFTFDADTMMYTIKHSADTTTTQSGRSVDARYRGLSRHKERRYRSAKRALSRQRLRGFDVLALSLRDRGHAKLRHVRA